MLVRKILKVKKLKGKNFSFIENLTGDPVSTLNEPREVLASEIYGYMTD